MKKANLRFFLSLAGLLLLATSAKAEVEEVKEGETIFLDFTKPTYRFVAEKSGMLKIETDSWTRLWQSITTTDFFFEDEALTKAVKTVTNNLEGENGWIYHFQVEEGEDYYLYGDYVFGYNFTLTMEDEDIGLYAAEILPTPSPEKIYPIQGGEILEVIFSYYEMELDKVWMEYETAGGVKRLDLDYEYYILDGAWLIYMSSPLNRIKNEIIPGSVFRVVLENPRYEGGDISGDFVEEGNLVLPYLYQPQTSIISERWPSTFKSYWPEGDEDGIVRLLFNAPLLEDNPRLEFGIWGGNDRLTEGEMPQLEDPKVTIEGNSITMDFTGVRRDHNKSVVSILLDKIRDHNNQVVSYYGGTGVWKEIKYLRLDQIVPAYEWEPGPGFDISKFDEISLWFDKAILDHLKIEGFRFDFDGEEEMVDIKECRIEDDAFDHNFSLCYIPVPTQAMKSENTTVTLVYRSLDGYDYDISIAYRKATTGLDNLATDKAEDRWEVINLKGQKVLDTERKADIEALPSGIYIVNGRKVFLGN